MRTSLRSDLLRLIDSTCTDSVHGLDQGALRSRMVSWVVTIEDTHNENLKAPIRTQRRYVAVQQRGVDPVGFRCAENDDQPSFINLPRAVRSKIYLFALGFTNSISLVGRSGAPPPPFPFAGRSQFITYNGEEVEFLAALPPIARMRNVIGREALVAYLSTSTFTLELDFTLNAIAMLRKLYKSLRKLDCVGVASSRTQQIPMRLRLAWRWPHCTIDIQTLVRYANLFAPGSWAMSSQCLQIIEVSENTPLTQVLTTIQEGLETSSKALERASDQSASSSTTRLDPVSRSVRKSVRNRWDFWSMIEWINDNRENRYATARAACRELCKKELEEHSLKFAEADKCHRIHELEYCDPFSDSFIDAMTLFELPPPPLPPAPPPIPDPFSDDQQDAVLHQIDTVSPEHRDTSSQAMHGITRDLAEFRNLSFELRDPFEAYLQDGIDPIFPLRHPYWTHKGCEYPFEESKAVADDLS
ncbi:hypothetical protein LTR86_007993 [Recurvomyces mirabilis]|nr:hypothetical protein LTR86_007993 [Recurvomyces mirabilis]